MWLKYEKWNENEKVSIQVWPNIALSNPAHARVKTFTAIFGSFFSAQFQAG